MDKESSKCKKFDSLKKDESEENYNKNRNNIYSDSKKENKNNNNNKNDGNSIGKDSKIIKKEIRFGSKSSTNNKNDNLSNDKKSTFIEITDDRKMNKFEDNMFISHINNNGKFQNYKNINNNNTSTTKIKDEKINNFTKDIEDGELQEKLFVNENYIKNQLNNDNKDIDNFNNDCIDKEKSIDVVPDITKSIINDFVYLDNNRVKSQKNNQFEVDYLKFSIDYDLNWVDIAEKSIESQKLKSLFFKKILNNIISNKIDIPSCVFEEDMYFKEILNSKNQSILISLSNMNISSNMIKTNDENALNQKFYNKKDFNDKNKSNSKDNNSNKSMEYSEKSSKSINNNNNNMVQYVPFLNFRKAINLFLKLNHLQEFIFKKSIISFLTNKLNAESLLFNGKRKNDFTAVISIKNNNLDSESEEVFSFSSENVKDIINEIKFDFDSDFNTNINSNSNSKSNDENKLDNIENKQIKGNTSADYIITLYNIINLVGHSKQIFKFIYNIYYNHHKKSDFILKIGDDNSQNESEEDEQKNFDGTKSFNSLKDPVNTVKKIIKEVSPLEDFKNFSKTRQLNMRKDLKKKFQKQFSSLAAKYYAYTEMNTMWLSVLRKVFNINLELKTKLDSLTMKLDNNINKGKQDSVYFNASILKFSAYIVNKLTDFIQSNNKNKLTDIIDIKKISLLTFSALLSGQFSFETLIIQNVFSLCTNVTAVAIGTKIFKSTFSKFSNYLSEVSEEIPKENFLGSLEEMVRDQQNINKLLYNLITHLTLLILEDREWKKSVIIKGISNKLLLGLEHFFEKTDDINKTLPEGMKLSDYEIDVLNNYDIIDYF